MEPVSIETKGGLYTINYACEKCDYKHRVKSAPDDNMEKILELSAQ